ncbi:DUF4898 domain-containing protein [Sulfolobus sp. S-194]|uniref:DUF4898 domain-containing protein n=1 Tax=Sulfolobus sp. S-194 TaxID=2512240 RepID=UPI001436F53F|nr:DUF4898 domain-containing protein [Sulfolobus sp. S-194]QIW24445.1 DUF4898 domain-containing protein [Sulfolobus sp. S-194]
MIDETEIEEFEDVLKLFKFDKKVEIPLKIISDERKFFNFILPKDKLFCIIKPEDYKIEEIVREIRKDTPFFIFNSEKLKDKIILLL